MGHRIPLLALASFGGSAIRVWEALSTECDLFDWRQSSIPHTTQSVITTIALGLIAGGVDVLLFIAAQMTAIPTGGDPATIKALQEAQASRLVPFTVGIGFIAGLTLDAVFRRLLKVDVIRPEGVPAGASEESLICN